MTKLEGGSLNDQIGTTDHLLVEVLRGDVERVRCKVVECERDVIINTGHDQLQKDKSRDIVLHLQLCQDLIQQHTKLFEKRFVSLGWVETEISA